MKLTPQMQQQLEQLKDIHLPEPISWYPLAIGWWIVIALAVITVILGVWWLMSKRQRLQKNILAELQQLPTDKPLQFVSNLSALLRRVAIYCQGQSVQTLSGQAWADFLSSGTNGLPKPWAELIANAPYNGQLPPDFESEQLRQAATTWVKHFNSRGTV